MRAFRSRAGAAGLAACAMLAAAAQAAEVSLEVSASRDRLFLGESLLLTVKVHGETNPPEPDLSAITNAAVRLVDSRSQNWSSFSMINGRVSRTGFSGRVLTYEITPTSAGRFVAGPVALAIGGRTLSAPGPVVEVAGVERQDTVLVGLAASRDTVLVDEPFDITLSVAVRRLPAETAGGEPLDPADPPTLSVPFLAGAPIAGLESPDVAGTLRGLLESRRDRPGFAINGYTLEPDPFDMDSFFNMNPQDMLARRKAKFRLDRAAVVRGGLAYMEYRLSLRYTPRREGDYTFGPAVLKGPVLVGSDDAGRLRRQAFFAVGPACVVRVVPPPEQGRPPTYIGAIGRDMSVQASLDAPTCKVGDPLSLTLRISGDVNMENISPPQLGLQTNLLRRFRVYDDTVKAATRDGAREYTYTIRPTAAGTYELPPIELAFYDTATRAYRSVSTAPIPVCANEAAQVGYEIVIAADTNGPAAGPGETAAASTLPIAPMSVDPAGTRTEAAGLRPWQAAVCVVSPLCFALAVSLRRARRLVARARRARRRSGAFARARSALAAAGRDGRDGARRVCDALAGYVADRLLVERRGMTPPDAEKALLAHGVEPELAGRFRRLHQERFDALYAAAAPAPSPAGGVADEAIALIAEIERRLPRGKGAGGTDAARALPLLLAALLLLPGVSAGADFAGRQFLWSEANAMLAAAGTEEQCLRAAETYAKLAETGARNGPLFYNMGAALLKAGRYQEALAALHRAERYSGSGEEIRRNMLLAIAGRDGAERPSLPWYRPLLFWHYDLGLAARIAIAVCAFAAVWLALLLRALGARSLGSTLLAVSLAAASVFGSSAATTAYQEARDSAAPYRFRAEAGERPAERSAP